MTCNSMDTFSIISLEKLRLILIYMRPDLSLKLTCCTASTYTLQHMHAIDGVDTAQHAIQHCWQLALQTQHASQGNTTADWPRCSDKRPRSPPQHRKSTQHDHDQAWAGYMCHGHFKSVSKPIILC